MALTRYYLHTFRPGADYTTAGYPDTASAQAAAQKMIADGRLTPGMHIVVSKLIAVAELDNPTIKVTQADAL